MKLLKNVLLGLRRDNMNILFLMGGHVDRNKEDYPLYLTEIKGKTILERQIEAAEALQPESIIFCIKEGEIKQYSTDGVISQLVTNAKIIPIRGMTKGAICTALLASEYIDNTHELLIMAIDDFMDASGLDIIQEFRKSNADAGVVCFNSIHPRYSFVKIDFNGEPIQFSEKKPISKHALISFYYFRSGADFVSCAKDVIRKDRLIKGNFYISQSLNEMILRQKSIVVKEIESLQFHPLKTEHQLAEYIMEYNKSIQSK